MTDFSQTQNSRSAIHAEQLDYGAEFEKKYREFRTAIAKPNILLTGGTGVGKSALINTLFSAELAKVGAGKPQTQSIASYEGETVTLFDSAGYETGEDNQQKYFDEVIGFILDRQKSPTTQIHLVWYCISCSSHRVLDIDLQIIQEVSRTRPCAVVLTKADTLSEARADEMKAAIRAGVPGVALFETSTDTSLNLKGNDLLEWSYQHLDESLREAFVSSLNEGIDMKLSEGRKACMIYAAAAAAIAASPIPFSDAALLVPNQIAMIARLASIWDLPNLRSLAGSTVVSTLVSQLGRTLAGNLIKFIPGLGSWVGGAVNAAVASAITAAIGFSINEICGRIARDRLQNKVNDLSSYFDTNALESLIRANMDRAREETANQQGAN